MTRKVPSGSRVLTLLCGRAYGVASRPGTYVLVQFEDAESGTVREAGSGALLKVALADLKPLKASANTRSYDLENLSEEKQKEIKEKHDAIEPLLPYRRIPKSKLEERAKECGTSAKTLRKWIRRHRSDPRFSSLARKRRKDQGESRFHPAIEKALDDAIKGLLADANKTLKEAHTDLKDDVQLVAKKLGLKEWRTPSYGTMYNRYRVLSEKDKTEAKLGVRPAKLTHGIVRGSLSDIDHPLCLIQVDHLEIPIVIVDDVDRFPIGKAWITVLIDVFSRCVYGYYLTLEAPGTLSLGLAMLHAILPKHESIKLSELNATWPISGFPWTVHADNAGEFHGNMVELAAQEYGFDLLYRKVKHPNYGGHIESYLGTLSEKLRQLPGSKREGPESLGDTDPEESAAMSLAELERYILTLIIEYHSNPHSGLKGMTPLAKFSAGMRGAPGVLPVGEMRQAEDAERLRMDFLPCDTRTVQPRGIRWDHIDYVDDCLQPWVNAKDPNNISEKRAFLVRRDPRDITRIHFLDPVLNVYQEVGTRNLTRPSMSLWELRATIAWLKEQGRADIDEDLIFAARAMRRALVSTSQASTRAAKNKRAREEQRQKEWEKGAKTGTTGTAESVPDTESAKTDEQKPESPGPLIGRQVARSWK